MSSLECLINELFVIPASRFNLLLTDTAGRFNKVLVITARRFNKLLAVNAGKCNELLFIPASTSNILLAVSASRFNVLLALTVGNFYAKQMALESDIERISSVHCQQIEINCSIFFSSRNPLFNMSSFSLSLQNFPHQSSC